MKQLLPSDSESAFSLNTNSENLCLYRVRELDLKVLYKYRWIKPHPYSRNVGIPEPDLIGGLSGFMLWAVSTLKNKKTLLVFIMKWLT